jgi:AAA domain
MESREWADRVGRIFDIRPRVNTRNTVWHPRDIANQQLSQAIERPGGHLCLDGPTGVGKTSLIHTYIADQRLRHIPIMVTQAMDWVDFCRRLVGIQKNNDSVLGGDFEAGIHNGLPTAKFKISISDKSKLGEDIAYTEQLVKRWSEEDVAQMLSKRDAILLIDDLERANDDLMSRISDLCKILTQQYTSRNAKLVMVGSGNIFQRLYHANPALDERVSQVSLGGFAHQNDSRMFITQGLDKLKLRNPWNTIYDAEKSKRNECRDAIWQAANGLPKSLNRLGYDIAMRGLGRTAISGADIVDHCQAMIDRNLRQYSQEFPDVIDLVNSDEHVARLIKCMYENGISRIHRYSDMLNKMRANCNNENENTPAALDSALVKLVNIGFIVTTGFSSSVLFVKHPAAAHTLGVVVRDPDRIVNLRNFSRSASSAPIQLDLPGIFTLQLNHDREDTDIPSPEA